MSSSGCERNWSTFALVHTKLRNRLSYDKLHKLVYVHYNLKLRIQLFQDEMQSLQDMQCHLESDSDPCSILMDCAMYDEDNPIMDWLCNSRSQSVPTLDEYVDSDLDLEPPNPSAFIVEELGMDEAEVAAFKNVTFPKKNVVRKEGLHLRKKRKKILQMMLNQILRKVALRMSSQGTAALMMEVIMVSFQF